jgi:hypothetical protein
MWLYTSTSFHLESMLKEKSWLILRYCPRTDGRDLITTTGCAVFDKLRIEPNPIGHEA